MPAATGHDDPEIRRQFGSESARLVYGRDPDTGKLVYISKARRGKACGLICPHCEASLVANLKDDIKAAHFSHHGPACGGGPETAIHLLCKQIILEALCLVIPAQIARHEDREAVLASDREIRLDGARMEHRMGEIVPDLIAQSSGHPILIEIAVTHPCDEEKLKRLARRGISAVEIDMSAVPRNANPDEIRQAVLCDAPRIWLYSVRIERGAAALRRQSEEEAREAEQALLRKAKDTLATYREYTAAAVQSPLDAKRVEGLRKMDLIHLLDMDVGGSGSFTVDPHQWKSEILCAVLRHRPHYPFIATEHIVEHLLEAGMAREQFTKIDRDVARKCRALDAEFRTPWQAVHRFCQFLVEAGVAEQKNLQFALDPRLARRWHDWEIAERQRSDRTARVHALVDDILELVPKEYRGGATRDAWLASIDRETGVTMAEAIHDGRTIEQDLVEILDVLTLKSDALPKSTCGLPVARAMEEALPRRAEKQQVITTRREAEAAYDRRQALILRSERDIDEADRGDWYRTPLVEHGGLLPLDLAEQSAKGLATAEAALKVFANERRRDRYIALHRERLLEFATQLFGDQAARVVRQPIDRKLGGLPPLIYCRDERTLQEAIVTLQWLAQT